MNKCKIFLSNFFIVLLIANIFSEFSLRAIIPLCRELESKEKIYEIKEVKYDKKDCRPISFSSDINNSIPTYSIYHPNSFTNLFETNHISIYSYFPYRLFNHSPPIFNSV